MSSPSTISMLAPDGSTADVPFESAEIAVQKGARPVSPIRMQAPDGSFATVPPESVVTALSRQAKFAPELAAAAAPPTTRQRIDSALAPGNEGAGTGRSTMKDLDLSYIANKAKELGKGVVSGIVQPIIHPLDTIKSMGEQTLAGGWSPNGYPVFAPTGNQERDNNNLAAQAIAQKKVAESAQQSTEHPFYTAGTIAGPALLEEGVRAGVRGVRGARVAKPTPPPAPDLTLAEKPSIRRYVYGDNPEKTVNDAVVAHVDAVQKTKEANAAINFDNQQAAADWYRKQRAVQDQYELDKEAVGQKQADLNRQAANETLQRQKDYNQQTYIAKQIHDAQVEQAGRAKQIADNLVNQSQEFGDATKALAKNVAKQGKELYDVVQKKVGDAEVPADNVVTAVKFANDKLIQGSPESIKQFNSILSHDPGDAGAPTGGIVDGVQLSPEGIDVNTKGGRALYDLLNPKSKENPFKFSDLQGYYTELGQKMAETQMLPDVYRATKFVHDTIGKEMMSIAESKGAAADLKSAQKFWTQYKDTFHNMNSVATGGSPVARVIRAQDPAYMAAPITGKASARAIEMLGKYDPDVAKQAAAIAKAQNDLKSLPKVNAQVQPFVKPPAPPPVEAKTLAEPTKPIPPEIATAPTPKDLKPMPEAPELDQILQAKRVADLATTTNGLTRLSGWDFASVAGAAGSLIRLHPMLAMASLSVTILRHGIGAILNRPGVVESLTRITPGDAALIERFSPKQQGVIRQGIASVMVDNARRGNLTSIPDGVGSLLNTKQLAAVTAALAVANRKSRYTSVDQVMQAAKEGEITPAEAQRITQQLGGNRATVTRPIPPPK